MTASIAWSKLVGQLKTGDVLSFAGNNPVDWAIQFVEGQPYTHVGMVIRDESGLWFWDAPGEGSKTFPDPVSKNPNQKGARVASLEQIVSYYMDSGPGGGGEIEMWCRQLSPAVTPEQQAALKIFVRLADGTPFPGDELKKVPPPYNDAMGFAASWAFGREANGTIAGSFFCAQLVAQSYMAMGLLPIRPRPANAYDPAWFNSDDSSVLPLIGCKLGPVLQVTF